MLMLAVIILVGNKSDLTEQREVTIESGQEYAERCAAPPDLPDAVSCAPNRLYPNLLKILGGVARRPVVSRMSQDWSLSYLLCV